MQKAPPGQPLQEIGPNIWSNGHIRFDPIRKHKLEWAVRFAVAPTSAPPIAHVRWNGAFGEHVLFTRDGQIFGWDCLDDIAMFLIEQTARVKDAEMDRGRRPRVLNDDTQQARANSPEEANRKIGARTRQLLVQLRAFWPFGWGKS